MHSQLQPEISNDGQVPETTHFYVLGQTDREILSKPSHNRKMFFNAIKWHSVISSVESVPYSSSCKPVFFGMLIQYDLNFLYN